MSIYTPFSLKDCFEGGVDSLSPITSPGALKLIYSGFETGEWELFMNIAVGMVETGKALDYFELNEPGYTLLCSLRFSKERVIEMLSRMGRIPENRERLFFKEKPFILEPSVIGEVEKMVYEYSENFKEPFRALLLDGFATYSRENILENPEKLRNLRKWAKTNHVTVFLLTPPPDDQKKDLFSAALLPKPALVIPDSLWIFENEGYYSEATLTTVDYGRLAKTFKLEWFEDSAEWLITDEKAASESAPTRLKSTLSPALSEVLKIIREKGPIGPTEIASIRGKHTGTVKKQVRDLANLGLVVNNRGKYSIEGMNPEDATDLM